LGVFTRRSLEETGIRGVLLDIGGIALFGGIHFGFLPSPSLCFLLISALSLVPLWLRLAGHGRHFFMT
jgi:hypothetical protein